MEDVAAVFFVILRQYHTNNRVFLKSTFIRYLYPFLYRYQFTPEMSSFPILNDVGDSRFNLNITHKKSLSNTGKAFFQSERKNYLKKIRMQS